MQIHYNAFNFKTTKKTVITIGSFDGVHYGHTKLIQRINMMAQEIDGESVLLTFDPHPRKVVYPNDHSLNLLTELDEKLKLFEKEGIDHVIVHPFSIEFSQLSSQEYVENFIVKNINPAIIVIGHDHKFGLNRSGDINLLKDYEKKGLFKVYEIHKQELEEITVSSTKIRNALKSGDIVHANELLSRPYSFYGHVIQGKKLGRELGFPTANIKLRSKDKLVPKNGVYACKINLGDLAFDAMMYIGPRPTLEDDNLISIEINIFDFDQDIYEELLQVEIYDFIREDAKFDNIESLKQQLFLDKQASIASLQKYKKNAPVVSSLAIAILNYNGTDYLESFLPLISDSIDDDATIYVIDNASTDDSVDMLATWFPEIKVIQLSENYGFAEGYNKGMSFIEEPYTILLNSDVQVDKHWIKPMMDIIQQDPSVGAVCPKILSLERPDEFEYAGAGGGLIDKYGYAFCRGRVFDHCEKDTQQYNDTRSVFWATGAAMLVRTKLFKNLGGFDGSYFAHWEEIDFCWRIKRAGYKVIYTGSSHVFHIGGGTIDYNSPRKLFLNYRNNFTTLVKNLPSKFLWWKLFVRLKLDGISWFRLLLGGHFNSAKYVFKAMVYNLGHIRSNYKSRKALNQIIDKYAIGPMNWDGYWNKSIIWRYFVQRKKDTSDLSSTSSK